MKAGRILVTGGTGFLGRSVVERLAKSASDRPLRLLVRPTSDRSGLPEGIEFIEGDVTDPVSVRQAAEGCDAIIHAAALVTVTASPEAFDRVNVGGLRHVLDAAETTGAERVVYVSSFIALGPTENAPERKLDVGTEARLRRWVNDYERTKTIADRLARQRIAEGYPLVVAYPGIIYGPGVLTEGNFVVRGLLEVLEGNVPFLVGEPDRLWNYVHVEDVADGIGRCLERAPLGGRYLLGGENVELGEFYRLVEELSGVSVPNRWLPNPVAKALAVAMKGSARLTGGRPKLTPDVVEICRHDWAYTSAIAEEELGYTWRPLREGLAETIEWLERSGRWRR